MSLLFWACTAVVFLIIELATGTFFFLALALSAGVTALVAPVLQDTLWQICLACALSLFSCIGLALRKKRRGSGSAGNNLDIGQSVHVSEWKGRRARVKHRGTMWDAVLKEGAPCAPGRHRIVGFDSSTLILEPEP